jgi:hypothetical protein
MTPSLGLNLHQKLHPQSLEAHLKMHIVSKTSKAWLDFMEISGHAN